MSLKFERLTRPAIKALAPGQKLNEHGITAERQRNGDVRYSINIMVDGERIHRVIGRESEGVTRYQAEQAIETLRTRAREERLDLPQGRKLHMGFPDAAEDYLKRMEETGGKNLKNKRRHLRQHLVPYFRNTRLDGFTTFALQKYRKHRNAEGVGDAAVNREFATLLHLLNRASSKEWRWIKSEHVPEIPRAAEARKKIEVLSAEQRVALIESAAEDCDPHIWLFVMFGLNAGMRHTEILERRYDEVDWSHCRIWINRAKAGERMQPITPGLRDALLRQREMADDQEGWIFPALRSSSKAPHRTSMAKHFRRVVIRAKLSPQKVTPHVMRHTAISQLVMAGVDPKTAQQISGHKTLTMLMHYVHTFGSHVDEAAAKLDTGITPKLHTPSPEGVPGDGTTVVQFPQKTAA